MKLLLTGLPESATEESVKQGMEMLGVVTSVELVSKINDVWAIIEMPITPDHAFKITQQVCNIWHEGRFVSARILNH